VETIAILYGTLSIKTDKTADHIVINNNNNNDFHTSQFSSFVNSTSCPANNSITQLCSNAQTTINNPAKKNRVA
jgi:hypothetical protein